jgi:hypothetical protein
MVTSRPIVFAILAGAGLALFVGAASSWAPKDLVVYAWTQLIALVLAPVALAYALRRARRATVAVAALVCYATYLAAVPFVRGPWLYERSVRLVELALPVVTLGAVRLGSDGVHLSVPAWAVLFWGLTLFWQGLLSQYAGSPGNRSERS